MNGDGKFTDGPWIIEKKHKRPMTSIGTPVAKVGPYLVGCPQDYGESDHLPDAKLVSAAPKLYRAAKAVLANVNYKRPPENKKGGWEIISLADVITDDRELGIAEALDRLQRAVERAERETPGPGESW